MDKVWSATMDSGSFYDRGELASERMPETFRPLFYLVTRSKLLNSPKCRFSSGKMKTNF